MSAPTATVTTAQDDAGESAGRASRTAAYFAAFAAMGLTAGSLGPTLPGLAARTHSSFGEVSLLFAARSLGFLLGSFFGGRWLDRAPGHRVMAAALVAMSLAMSLVPAVPLLWVLAVLMLALGAAEGTVDVGGNTLLVWAHGGRVGPYMNGLHFFFGVGALVSPLVVAGALFFGHGLAPAYWALALPPLPFAVWLLRVPAPTAPTAAEEGAEVSRGLVVLIALFFFLYVGAESSFGGWVYTYAVTLGLSDETRAAYLTSAFWGSLTLGRLLGVPLAARFRPRTVLLCDLAGCLASTGLMLAWPDSPAALVAGTLGLGLSMASVFPTTLSFAERRVNMTGRVTGYLLVGASAGGMLLPWLIGQLFEREGPRSTTVVIACALALELAVLAALLRHPARD